MVKTFKNKLFIENTESTNIVYCTGDISPGKNWVECGDSENNLNQLYMQNGIRYYGYL